MKTSRSSFLALLCLLLLQAGAVQANEAFPVRSLFPKVAVIELEELYDRRDGLLIFDVRSRYEYDTLHISNARHLALDDPDFIATLQQLRQADPRPMVFYCNGHTCKKSYQATHKAMQGNLDAVLAYDAGIFDWTRAYPAEAVLLGKSPVDPARLISKEKLEAHMLAPEAFGERVGENTIVLDIRETIQKNTINLFPMRQRSVSLDNSKLRSYVDRAKRENKTLMFYDAVGKQVHWLQYYLEDQGVKNYYFMKGGAKAFLNY
ncbi:MAG TPA: rhodanese-like domain-containing protein [Gammaproteobacteria bacterium]|jgi:rhodanese-related sulfurtransferase